MHHPLRFAAIAWVMLILISAAQAFGASVEAVNKDQSRVILKLTQVELAAAQDDDMVLIEVAARPAFVVAGRLTKINPVKKTVVVILEEPDPRFAKRQGVRFLSLFFNPLLSPVLASYSQYHQYARSSVEAGFGGVYDKYMEKVGDSRTKSELVATRIDAESYMLVSPRFFGGGFGYHRLAGTLETDANGEQLQTDVTINQVRPGAWLELEPGWVLGLRYDYTLLDHVDKDGGPSFSYDLGELVFGVTHYSPDLEFGLTYKDKATFTAIDTVNDLAGKSQTVESTVKTPAILDAAFRSITSPLFYWGMSIGYVFYERELKEGQELRIKPAVSELLRYRLMLEWRLDDGSKIDALLTYDGGRAPNRIYGENVANKVGMNLTYATPAFFEHFLIGGTLETQGGAITIEDEDVDPLSGRVDKSTREIQTFGTSLLVFGRMEFDPLAKKGKR
jgi:hypothetical protein